MRVVLESLRFLLDPLHSVLPTLYEVIGTLLRGEEMLCYMLKKISAG